MQMELKIQHATLLILAEEILESILYSAMSDVRLCPRNRSSSKSTIWALARTCRHLYRIATPLIYRTLQLDFPRRILQPVCSSGKLLRTLDADPSLAMFCQELDLHVSDICPARCEADLKCLELHLPCFKNVKVLRLEASFDGNTMGESWEFIRRCANNMPRLESLFLQGRNWAPPSIPDVLQQIQIPTLRELTINGRSTSNLTHEMEKDRSPSNITKLHFHLVQAQVATLSALLNWPGALSHFSIDALSTEVKQTDHHPSYFDLPMLQKLLLRHKNSLTYLRLPSLVAAVKGKLVDFSEFSVLEELAFPRSLLNDNLDEASESLSQLLTPKIKLFILIIRIDSLKEWSDTGSRGCRWVMNLAQEAVKKRSTLKEVNIQVTPWLPGSEERLTSVWNVIQDLDHRFRPHGIAITHTNPIFKKEVRKR